MLKCKARVYFKSIRFCFSEITCVYVATKMYVCMYVGICVQCMYFIYAYCMYGIAIMSELCFFSCHQENDLVDFEESINKNSLAF